MATLINTNVFKLSIVTRDLISWTSKDLKSKFLRAEIKVPKLIKDSKIRNKLIKIKPRQNNAILFSERTKQLSTLRQVSNMAKVARQQEQESARKSLEVFTATFVSVRIKRIEQVTITCVTRPLIPISLWRTHNFSKPIVKNSRKIQP